jgi:hypothetical protein
LLLTTPVFRIFGYFSLLDLDVIRIDRWTLFRRMVHILTYRNSLLHLNWRRQLHFFKRIIIIIILVLDGFLLLIFEVLKVFRVCWSGLLIFLCCGGLRT